MKKIRPLIDFVSGLDFMIRDLLTGLAFCKAFFNQFLLFFTSHPSKCVQMGIAVGDNLAN